MREAKKILKETAMLIEKYPNIQLHFYSNDAVDISERLQHGLLDFAVVFWLGHLRQQG